MELGEDEFPLSVLALGPPAAPGESSPA
jgi:hypothetical protein